MQHVLKLIGDVVTSQRKHRADVKLLRGQIQLISENTSSMKDASDGVHRTLESRNEALHEKLDAELARVNEAFDKLQQTVDIEKSAAGDVRVSLRLGLRALLGVTLSTQLIYTRSHVHC